MNRLLFFSAMFFLMACNNSQTELKSEEGSTLPPQYFYYPRANIYFDSANKNYFFQGSDSLSWQTARQIPAVMLALMDKGVLVQNPPDPVWKDNETHRLVYSAVLYATPGDTVVQKKLVKPVRKVDSTKAAADSAPVVLKERKGFGKLIDKIFGRNKKKKEEPQADTTNEKP
jgi:hypothetical protein